MSHTPEPWENCGNKRGGCKCGSIWRRIVACVNACAQTDTETLEVYFSEHGDRLVCSVESQILRRQRDILLEAGTAIVERWDTPLWKDVPHTAEFINKLRKAIEEINQGEANERK